MRGRIPTHFIDSLLQRIDIVDLISSRVPLKRAGQSYQARCPFHEEKTPSFTVSPDRQTYHCFGCGVHGTAIGFLMEYDHLSFPEAIEELAHRVGMAVPREVSEAGGSPEPDHAPLRDLMEQAAEFYRLQLRQHALAHRAVAYVKQRGLSPAIVGEFGIGYAPPGWDNLLRALGSDDDTIGRLTLVGLLVESEGRRYDRFRDRLIFPIRDRRGRTIGFGGRVLGDDKPKYLNSPETPLFHKGRELYGLYEAQRALRRIEKLLVVEGYMDVVALAQFGIRYAVATLGTATTPEHLERLFRATGEVVFCFDGDKAGRDAAWKALQVSLPAMKENRTVRFLFLPEGEDPDTLVRQEGMERFEERIDQALPLSTFLFGQLEQQADLATPEGRARLGELAKPLIAKLPPGMLRDVMEQTLSQRVGLPINIPSRQLPAQRPRRPRGGGARPTLTPVRLAIALLLRRPELALLPELPADWSGLEGRGHLLLSDLLELVQGAPNLNQAAMLERWRGSDDYDGLNRLAGIELAVPEEGYEAEFRGVLTLLEQQQRGQETERLLAKAGSVGLNEGEKRRLRELLAKPG